MTQGRISIVEYAIPGGQMRRVRCRNFQSAKAIARSIALATGRRAIVRQIPRATWRLFVISLVDGQITRTRATFTKRQAIEFWRQWRERHDGGVCVFWPDDCG
ncbi:MAG: hypothetical protein KF752_11830 [Pirellulaceae bacterium]|nr:hypothetical protein [Pirellulaceae bacterium]